MLELRAHATAHVSGVGAHRLQTVQRWNLVRSDAFGSVVLLQGSLDVASAALVDLEAARLLMP